MAKHLVPALRTLTRQWWASHRGLILAASLLLTTSCTTVEPLTGRRQFIITSPQAEMNMGMQAWNDIVDDQKPSKNPAYNAAVERVGRNIADVVNQPDFAWEFKAFGSDTANAFCLPGGKVAVYDGLFKYIDNDAELAAVIGHEVAHAVARHGGERMTQALLVKLGEAAVAKAVEDETDNAQQRWLLAYTGVTALGYTLPYSRTHEYAADELGLVYMARAGYNPDAALSFWSKFAKDSHTPAGLEFLSTHPVGENRIQRIRELLPRARREYLNAPVQRNLGNDF